MVLPVVRELRRLVEVPSPAAVLARPLSREAASGSVEVTSATAAVVSLVAVCSCLISSVSSAIFFRSLESCATRLANFAMIFCWFLTFGAMGGTLSRTRGGV